MLMRILLKRWSMASFALGAGAVTFGGAILRPVLVSAVKLGMEAKDMAAQAVVQAKMEAASIKSQAEESRSTTSDPSVASALEGIRADLKKLRDEVAAKPSRGSA